MARRQNAHTRSFVLVQRQIEPIRLQLHPFAAAGIGLFVLALLGWSVATTSYALFRDEFLMQLVSRHTAAERASSAEIARLKTEIARTSSRLLIEREEFSRKLGEFAERQTAIERRQELLSGQMPEEDTPPAGDPGELRLGTPDPVRESRISSDASRSMAEIERRYEAIEKRQAQQMAGLRARVNEERQALSRIYASLGLRPQSEPVKAGVGGLYIPSLSTADEPDAEPGVNELRNAIAEAELLRRGLEGVPVRNPAPGAAEASGYGNRPDPFLGTMAFHSGVDLALPGGAPARTTASGTVVSAGWNGGYGLMVEVRHEHGFSTRYAHLSKIAVAEGDRVKADDIVGYVGSTGRSTGPHLHYETRLNNKPLNPDRFLAAADMLQSTSSTFSGPPP